MLLSVWVVNDMFVSRCQNVGEVYEITTADKSFESVATLKYLGMTVSNQN
jgi:hypothetical protein